MNTTKLKFARSVQIATNLSIIFVALVGSTVLVKNHLLKPSVVLTSNRPTATSANATGRRELPSGPAQGTQLSVPGISWSDSEETVVLVLSDKCKYCTDSAPFYKQLAAETAKRNGVRVVAVFPEEPSAGRKYLDDLGVNVGDIKQVTLGSIGIKATPTLMIVDSAGRVKQSWVGLLNNDRETEVFSRMKT